MLAARRARAQIERVTDENGYTEHRLKVARTARWGLIGALGGTTKRIWIVLHGYGQRAAEFGAFAEWPADISAAFVFPEALQRFYVAEPNATHANAPVGASWMTRDARFDDIADNHGYLDNLLSVATAEAPQARVSVFGFSQGGSTAARWAEARARDGAPLASLVLWGSLLPPETDIGPDAPLRVTPLKYVCGTRDKWVTQARIQAESARLEAASFPFEAYRFDGGHRLDDDTLRTVLSAP
jgi:predicted esterase